MAIRMTGRPTRAALMTACALAFALSSPTFSGCNNADDEAAGDSAGPGGPGGRGGGDRPPPGVRVIELESGQLDLTVEFTGELLARDVVALAPDVSGRLVTLLVDEGDSVTAGQQIASLDDEATRRNRAEATARVESARARVAQAEAQRTQDSNEVDRREPLTARDAFPASELARLRDALSVTEQAVDVARAQLSEAEASLNSLRTALSHTQITAPFSGLVTQRHVTVGAMVSPQSPVVTLVDEGSLRFEFRLPENRLRDLDEGTSATLRFDAYPDRLFEAVVSHLGQVVDRESRTVEVRLLVESDGAALRHGMFGRGALITDRLENALVVPPAAIETTPEGAEIVWVVQDGAVTSHPVDILMRTEDARAISGVSAGDAVILSPPMGLTDGAPVYVVGAPSAEQAPAEGSGSEATP